MHTSEGWQDLGKIAADGEKTTLKVEIKNITQQQADEFTRLFAWMNLLGGHGCSRKFTVSYDGDGAARASIEVGGEAVYPEEEEQQKEDEHNYEKLHFGFE
jgi:hypothetical protein